MVRSRVLMSLCLVLLVAAGCGRRGSVPITWTIDETPPTIDTSAVDEYVTVDSASVAPEGNYGEVTLALTVKDLPEGKKLVAQWLESPGTNPEAYPIEPDGSGKATVTLLMTARQDGSSVVLALLE